MLDYKEMGKDKNTGKNTKGKVKWEGGEWKKGEGRGVRREKKEKKRRKQSKQLEK